MLAKILNLSNINVDEEVDEEFIRSLKKKIFLSLFSWSNFSIFVSYDHVTQMWFNWWASISVNFYQNFLI